MVKLSERIYKKDILNNKYLVLCYDIMHIIQKDHDAVICKEDAGNLNDIYERNYIITFAYLMGRNAGESKLLSNKFVNGELKKDIVLDSQNDDYKTKAKIYPKRNYYCPDFVIHTSHGNNGKYEGQYLIMEAKTTSKLQQKEFEWDLFKLNLYVEYLDFDLAVYLIVNTSIAEVSSMVDKYNQKGFWCSSKLCGLNRRRNNKEYHIYFLIQESVDKSPKIFELKV